MEKLELLVTRLCSHFNELPWLEFKHNDYDPETIGRNISALANGATLEKRRCAYYLWGVDDKTHEIIGTDDNLQTLKKGNEELENWLRRMLSKNADFEYQTVEMNNVTVGVLIIKCATNQPVSFQQTAYIRVGSYTKKLKDYPELQSRLWSCLHSISFEDLVARTDLPLNDALRLLDYSIYFELIGMPQPETSEGIAHYLLEEGILTMQDNGLYSITNMGAVLFAKKLKDFPTMYRKAIRVSQFEGNSKFEMLKNDTNETGYVVGFESLMKYIDALIPSQEVISGAVREKHSAFPPLAIREIIANALIHQDFSITGAGPTVEIFSNRIEVTNPGVPLVDIKRIIDTPPRSRNEKLAALMRRLGMCEELGTGWDRIIITCECARLPAPKIEVYNGSTKVVLFSEVPFSSLSPEDKLRACYMHACILYVQGEQLSNSSLRARFGVAQSSSGSISRLIKEAVAKQLIKPLDPHTSNKYMKYVPIWA